MMNTRSIVSCCFFSIMLLLAGCSYKAADPEPDNIIEHEAVRNTQSRSIDDFLAEGSTVTEPVVDRPIVFDTTAVAVRAYQEPATAHTKYRNDPVEYFVLPPLPKTKRTAVVGSTLARFFTGTNVRTSSDLKSLSESVPLPIGTHLPLGEQIKNADTEFDELFKFEDNFGYFYRTEYNGKEGIVFGSDLVGVYESVPEKNLERSLYYRYNGRFDRFLPIAGTRVLGQEEHARIEKDRVVFQRVRASEYRLDTLRPDDMIALYRNEADDEQNPVFISTDLISQGIHLFFDKYLQFVEEYKFVPRLTVLVRAYVDAVNKAMAESADASPAHARTLALTDAYFQVALGLLALAPTRVIDRESFDMEEIRFEEKNIDAVLAWFEPRIAEEIRLILAANGPAESPNFDYQEDYSQFKPRGHYTKNGILSTYFRVMMWFGRIHLLMGTDRPVKTGELADAVNGQNATSAQLAARLFPVACFITKMNADAATLFEQWEALFDPVTALIGMSDDLSLKDTMPFVRSLPIKDFSSWVNEKENIADAINRANRELRKPAISGNSVFTASAGPGLTPPLGFRLFGQRFTLDSAIHNEVSAPRLPTRQIVRGLDIMKAFGSKTADALLAASDYPEMNGLRDTLDAIEKKIGTAGPRFWSETYYTRILALIKSQACFEQGAGFYFTETPAWNVKSQLSSHGTWASLRHDTILYVKQSFAEMGGMGDYEPTYRTLPVPEPVHYIEPNVMFFESALAAVKHLGTIANKYRLYDDLFAQRIATWVDVLTRCLDIVRIEYDDRDVSVKDIAWIPTVPAIIAKLVAAPGTDESGYTEDSDQFRCAVIADVFTNGELGVALETGIGIPYRMFVCLNDRQGKKRIATGYVSSYYEFLVAQNERMTNEEWRALVYAKDADLTERMPFWSKGITLPPREK